jgi:peptidoglycan hydrolase-like protein with peptidoglycan-binding domain
MHNLTAGRRGLVALALVAALALSGCSDSSSGSEAAGRETVSDATTTSTAPTTTTSTTAAPTTTTTVRKVPAPPPGLRTGSRGPEVQALEQRLIDLNYDPGRVDGTYDSSTQHAVMAFQKVYGLARTGRATQDVLDRLTNAETPVALVPGGGSTRVEVDLKRQVLFLYKGNAIFRILPISTGSGKRYCVDGECAKAVTPGGSFRVTRRISGWRTSRLGKLYNPLYFNGGIAIHGAPSVPGYPASHGCVRIPMYASSWFPAQVPNGTPVYVVGGPKAPVPFNEPAPGDAPPSSTTTAPGSSSSSSSSTSSTSSTTSPTTSTTTAAPPVP